jgi:hypothetical protein
VSVYARALICCTTHELQSLQRPGLHRRSARKAAENDRAARARRGQLRETHLAGAGVMVEGESDLIAVERDGPVDIASLKGAPGGTPLASWGPTRLRGTRLGLTRDGGHLTGGTAGPAGRLSVCRASVRSTPRSSGSRLPAW